MKNWRALDKLVDLLDEEINDPDDEDSTLGSLYHGGWNVKLMYWEGNEGGEWELELSDGFCLHAKVTLDRDADFNVAVTEVVASMVKVIRDDLAKSRDMSRWTEEQRQNHKSNLLIQQEDLTVLERWLSKQ